jgi:uncharacterized protein (DUF4415 family)
MKSKKTSRKVTKSRASRTGSWRRAKSIKPWDLSLSAPVRDPKMQGMKIGDFYRPLKKPITVRLDADVLAWFKRDGRRYQTRINAALRKVMEREMKLSG